MYNKADVEIGKFIHSSVIEPEKTFFGVWCFETIGRINIWDEGIIPDAIDNIQLWEGLDVPTVSEWGLIGIGVLTVIAGAVLFGRRRAAAA